MHPIIAHGAAGIWDEVACLAIPATAILGVALAVLREKPSSADPPAAGAIDDTPANEESATSGGTTHGELP
jgi:hypothetical protein